MPEHDAKSQRSFHGERQATLKQSDRRKNKAPKNAPVKPWKHHKGWGTRSGRPDCISRNYGLHEDAHGPHLITPEDAVDQQDDYDGESYDDICTVCVPERKSEVPGRLLAINILEVARFKQQKNTCEGFQVVSAPSRVLALPDDLSELGSDFDFDDDWEELLFDTGVLERKPTYAQVTKLEPEPT